MYTFNNSIVQFDHYGLAEKFPPQSESKIMITVYVLIFVFLIALFLIVTIQLIIRLVRKQIEGIIGPLILAIIAGIGWIFITRIMVGTNSVINMIEPLLITYLTFATLSIHGKKRNCSIIEKIKT